MLCFDCGRGLALRRGGSGGRKDARTNRDEVVPVLPVGVGEEMVCHSFVSLLFLVHFRLYLASFLLASYLPSLHQHTCSSKTTPYSLVPTQHDDLHQPRTNQPHPPPTKSKACHTSHHQPTIQEELLQYSRMQ